MSDRVQKLEKFVREGLPGISIVEVSRDDLRALCLSVRDETIAVYSSTVLTEADKSELGDFIPGIDGEQ